jgi:hypothetical protein
MDLNNHAVKIGQIRYAIFKSQNTNNGGFDVTFQFKDKQLHAHSFILWSISDIFKSTLLGPSSNSNEPIRISQFTYDDFKEFISFFYLGTCQLTLDNVMSLVHLADFYNVDILKKLCDDFLIKSAEKSDALKVYEALKECSLDNALNSVLEYIANNTEKVVKDDYFKQLSKDTIMDIVKMDCLTVTEEELFQAIYKWAEYRCMNNAKAKSEDSNIEDWIKFELFEILPYIRFPIMHVDFLHNFVVPKDFLFSSFKEINKILHDANIFAQKGTTSHNTSSFSNRYRGGKRIQFIDGEGCKAYAIIHDHFIIETLQKSFNKMAFDGYDNTCYWDILLPEVQNGLHDDVLTDASKYYLVRDRNTTLALKFLSKRQQSYCFGGTGNEKITLIAEVFPDSLKFLPGYGCKYQIV